MSKKDKLAEKLLKKPKDFTFDEMKSLLSYFGYRLKQGGKGSGVKFIKEGSNETINFHRPHPDGILYCRPPGFTVWHSLRHLAGTLQSVFTLKI